MACAVAVSCGGATATGSPSPSIGNSASADPSVYVATPMPTPRTTPPGTAAPAPTAATGESAQPITPTPVPNAKPTPSVEPGLWRIDGYVVDDSGAPLPAVCVAIGPLGCQVWSPKTDDRGYYFIDVAAARSTFDVYFTMPGHKTVWWRFIPEGPTEFNVILAKG